MTPPTDPQPEPPDRIAEIRQREQQATKGPWCAGRLIYDQAGDYVVWKHRGDGEIHLGGPQRSYVGNVGECIQPVMPVEADQLFEAEKADAEFIAHARQDVPYLLDLVASLQSRLRQREQEREALRDALTSLKRGDCWCEAGIGNPNMADRHSPACVRVAALISPAAAPSDSPARPER